MVVGLCLNYAPPQPHGKQSPIFCDSNIVEFVLTQTRYANPCNSTAARLECSPVDTRQLKREHSTGGRDVRAHTERRRPAGPIRWGHTNDLCVCAQVARSPFIHALYQGACAPWPTLVVGATRLLATMVTDCDDEGQRQGSLM